MRITFVLLFLPFFFNILLASPLLKPRSLAQQNSFPLKPRFYNEFGLQTKPKASWTGGLVPRNGDLETSSMAFEGCSSDRQEEIRKAVVIAASRVKSALSYLKKLDSNEPRYLKWFGEWELKRWNWVKEVFGHIEDSFQKHYILYDCHTGTETFLYARVVAVDRKKPVRMYLCPPFWDLPLDGLMSKVSVLIHESSHWDIHGGTRHPGLTRDDITRDPESGIIALAKSNPQEAIHNAYTYQFFAVDKPNLP